jgi:phosphopantetheine adenylyltransferase
MTETISCPQFVTLFSADAIAKLVSRHLVFSEFAYLVADSIHVPIGYTINHNEANALVNRTRETNEEARMLNGTRDVYKIALLGSEGSGKTGKV